MPANTSLAAAIVIVTHYNKPAVMEQIGNYVMTAQGKDAAGNARTSKYTDLSPTYDIPLYGAAFIALGVTDPVSLEKVNNIALTHT